MKPRAFAWALLSLLAWGSSVATATGSRPIVLVGIDGADWLAIDRLVDRGRLPTFARLKERGRTGILRATPPLLSPIIWTTIATGRRPEDHRVLDFMVDLAAGGQAPVTSSERRVAALWNVFSDRDRSVAVVGWFATWPAEPVRGAIVTDRAASRRGGAAAAAEPHAHARLAEALVARARQPDLLMLYLDGVDALSHRFVRDKRQGPGVIEQAYRDADLVLGRLAAAAHPASWILVCSDHGFYPDGAGVSADPAELAGPARAVTETVEVVGESPLVQSTTSDVGQVPLTS